MKANILQMKRMRRIVPAGKSADGPRPKTLKPAAIIALAAFSLLLISAVTNAMYIDKNGNVTMNKNLGVTGDISSTAGRLFDCTGQIMPVGSILAYFGTKAPEGWLLCDGSEIPTENYSGTDIDRYKELKDLIGATTPNLQGQFLRGLDKSGGIDPDGASRFIGSSQNDALQNHTHTYTDVYQQHRQGDGDGGTWFADNDSDSDTRSTSGCNSPARTSSETRPKNVAVNFIIKY